MEKGSCESIIGESEDSDHKIHENSVPPLRPGV